MRLSVLAPIIGNATNKKDEADEPKAAAIATESPAQPVAPVVVDAGAPNAPVDASAVQPVNLPAADAGIPVKIEPAEQVKTLCGSMKYESYKAVLNCVYDDSDARQDLFVIVRLATQAMVVRFEPGRFERGISFIIGACSGGAPPPASTTTPPPSPTSPPLSGAPQSAVPGVYAIRRCEAG